MSFTDIEEEVVTDTLTQTTTRVSAEILLKLSTTPVQRQRPTPKIQAHDRVDPCNESKSANSVAHDDWLALVEKLDEVTGERDALRATLVETTAERDALRATLNEVTADRGVMFATLVETTAERDALRATLVETTAERDAMRGERDKKERLLTVAEKIIAILQKKKKKKKKAHKRKRNSNGTEEAIKMRGGRR